MLFSSINHVFVLLLRQDDQQGVDRGSCRGRFARERSGI